MTYTNSPNWNDKFLDSMRQVTDAPADAVVASVIAEKGPGEAMRIFTELIHSIDLPKDKLPPQVTAFIEAHNRLPEWADPLLVKKGEEFFKDHGPSMLIILFYKSLPMLYTNAKGSRVLTQTGRLAHDPNSDSKFSRRIAETGQFLIEVMQPGGLAPGGRGIQTALRIRLIHASIRAFISMKGEWDDAALGKPINQEDLAETLMTFSVCVLDGLKKLGCDHTDEHEIAFCHCWKVIGHLLGIAPELLPPDPQSGRELFEKTLQRHSTRNEDGILLTKAIVEFVEKAIPEKIFDQLPSIMIKYLCGEKYAAMVDVQIRRGCLAALLPRFVRLLMGFIEKVEDHSEPIGSLSGKISMAMLRGMVNYFNKEKGRNFTIPEELRLKWGL